MRVGQGGRSSLKLERTGIAQARWPRSVGLAALCAHLPWQGGAGALSKRGFLPRIRASRARMHRDLSLRVGSICWHAIACTIAMPGRASGASEVRARITTCARSIAEWRDLRRSRERAVRSRLRKQPVADLTGRLSLTSSNLLIRFRKVTSRKGRQARPSEILRGLPHQDWRPQKCRQLRKL